MSVFEENKKRIYLAYQANGKRERDGTPTYHVSILITPKDPIVQHAPLFSSPPPTSAPHQRPGNQHGSMMDSRVFHAVNRIDVYTKREVWSYESRAIQSRTPRLSGVMLLGKLAKDVDEDMVERILGGVDVVNGDLRWRCTDWVVGALKKLSDRGIIPALPGSPDQVMALGKAFMDRETGHKGVSPPDEPIPTCDTKGRPCKSEIGGFPKEIADEW